MREKKKNKGFAPPMEAAKPGASSVRDAELEAAILAYLRMATEAQSAEKIGAALSLSPMVVGALCDALWAEGMLLRTKKAAYALPERMGMLVGTVQITARGDAYCLPTERGAQREAIRELHGALHGDGVWVYGDGARRGEVARIVRRAHETMIGTLITERGKACLQPEDMRLPERVALKAGDTLGAKPGDLVVARVLRFADEGGLLACVQQLLGDARLTRSALMGIVHQHGLEVGFSPACDAQAQEVAAWGIEQEAGNRLDLRGITTVTIDGADAKDFDDAISIEALPDGGERLGVHIADVSWYVRAGTTLDAEAQDRATSVYLPGLVLPMLPEAISNHCCSLLPNEDRLTYSAIIDLNADGEVTGYQLARSIIRSRERLVYDDVNALLGGDEQQLARYAHILDDVRRMAALSARIRKRRHGKGSLDFDIEEAHIAVDAQGEPTDIAPRPRGVSERMIEDFMLLANETVAQHAKERDLPFLYRVHEQPDGDKFQEFSAFLSNLGLRIHSDKGHITPKALQNVLEQAEGLPEYPVVARLMLRAMQKARYDPQPIGHFGLATADYCHFTAPIRRYPDLFIHRMLAAEQEGSLPTFARAMAAQAQSLAAHTSERERNAMEAERDADKLMMARYMYQHIGERFAGNISSVVAWGFYVTLPSTVEGLVHERTLGEPYSVNQVTHCLVGEHTGKVFRLGQAVTIEVESVDLASNQINFVLV